MPRKQEVEVVEAQVTGETTALSTPHQHVSHGLVYDPSDIDIPRGNIVQKLSQIDGPLGSLVVDRQHVVAKASTPVDVYVVRAVKGWRENVPFGDKGAYASNEAQYRECIAQGLDMVEVADISLMIPAPENEPFDEAAFPFPFGDKNFALARIYVSKDGYRQTYKRLVTYVTGRNEDYRLRMWRFESQLLTKGPYSFYAPALSLSPTPPAPEVLAFIQSF